MYIVARCTVHLQMHYVYDKDLKSPSRKKFADSVAHIAAQKWRTKAKVMKKVSSAKRLHSSGSGSRHHHLHVPGPPVSPIPEEQTTLLGEQDQTADSNNTVTERPRPTFVITDESNT